MKRRSSAGRSVAGKVVLVTGGARGIGAAAAAELSRRGAIVVLADIDGDALDAAVAAIPGSSGAVLDVTDRGACGEVVATILDGHGRLDIVWANAGIGLAGPVELADPDAWSRVIAVNLVGVYNTVRAALPAVIDANGYVAITSSLAAFSHAPMMSAYSASKAGAEAFADSLRIEVAHQGVAVGTVHLGWVATDMVTEADDDSAAFRRLRAAIAAPFGNTSPVEAIAAPLVDGIAGRRERLCLPGVVRLAHVLRPALRSRLFERDLRKVAPDLRADFARAIAEQGVRRASFGPRWSQR